MNEVGTGYSDEVAKAVSAGESSTTALEGSTEAAQFQEMSMDEIRNYRIEEEDSRRTEQERIECSAPADEEVPFHIPRD